MTTTAQPTSAAGHGGHGGDVVRVLGPDPDGGQRISMSGRQLFGDMRRLPGRLEVVVAAVDGVARPRGRILPAAVVADPALARAVLTRPTGFRQGRGVAALALTFGEGLLTSSGDLHRRQRRLVQPAFHARRLAAYALDAVQLAATRSSQWHDGQQLDIAADMSSLTLEVVGRTLFGTDVADEVAVVSSATHALLEEFPKLLSPVGMLAARGPTPLRRRLRRQIARLDGVVQRVVAARQASGDTGDVVSMLLAARDDETGAGMPDRQVRDEVLTLLLAGHETTAVALTWAWFELARHPEVRAELDAELAGAGPALEAAAWDRLPVTRAVVAETLRLHPPAYILGRRPTEDVTVDGYTFRRGMAVIMSPYALHRDARSWGPDAGVFRPSRWITPEGRYEESAPGQPRGAYLPFGAGSRMCIGAGFAVMEAVLLLGRLARDWSVEIEPSFEPDVRPAVTLRPGPMPATLHARPPCMR